MMNLRPFAAHQLPILFRALQDKGFILNPENSPDRRRIGRAPQDEGYRETVLGVHRPQALLAPPECYVEGALTSEYIRALSDAGASYERDWTFGYYEVPDVRVWPSLGVHSAASGIFLDVYCSSRALRNPKYEIPRRIMAAVGTKNRHSDAVLFYSSWFHNHYHWMIDMLPRLQLVSEHLRSGIPLIVPENFGQSRLSAIKSCLSAAGAPDARVLELTPGVHEFSRLVMPTSMTFPLDVSALQRDFLRSAFWGSAPEKPAARMIYVSRRDATVRRVANETELIAALEKRGFQTVTLSDRTLTDQAQLFSESKVVIGHHGAGLVNAIYSQPGSSLIEIFQAGHFAPSFARIAQLGQLKYSFVVGGPVKQDTLVDVRELEVVLNKMGF